MPSLNNWQKLGITLFCDNISRTKIHENSKNYRRNIRLSYKVFVPVKIGVALSEDSDEFNETEHDSNHENTKHWCIVY